MRVSRFFVSFLFSVFCCVVIRCYPYLMRQSEAETTVFPQGATGSFGFLKPTIPMTDR